MKHTSDEYFDLPTLVEMGDLDIRRIAREKPSLTVGGYFAMLSQFVDLAPAVSNSLAKFTVFHADDIRHWRNVETMIALLTDLGCGQCIPDLYSISHAREKGEWRLASFHAKKLMEEFGSLQQRILAAKRTKMAGNAPDDQDAAAAPDDALSLQEYVSCLRSEKTEQQPPAPVPHDSPDGEENKPLILAVDDSLDILTGIASVLSSEYSVFKLPKPAMLENVLQKVTPALFLLDYQMPELSGFDLVPIIRRFKKHENTPIIFLTSAGTVDNIATSIALGACDFIVKPFNPAVLREKIAKQLARKTL